jgi:biopolymer transport protein ExbB/TolQ
MVYSGHTNALTLNCVPIKCAQGEVDGNFRSNISILADRRQHGAGRANQRLRRYARQQRVCGEGRGGPAAAGQHVLVDHQQSRHFVRAFHKANRLQEIAALTAEHSFSPLAQVFSAVYENYRRQTGGSGPPRNLKPLERSAMTASSEAVTMLERRLTWLATIAAVSPFVGLFGTVIGVVDAFHGLGSAGSATLRAVAPGISEALITTAAGLFVAVPALVAYNQFAARLRTISAAIDDFSRELLNSLEEIPARQPGATHQLQTAPSVGGPLHRFQSDDGREG